MKKGHSASTYPLAMGDVVLNGHPRPVTLELGHTSKLHAFSYFFGGGGFWTAGFGVCLPLSSGVTGVPGTFLPPSAFLAGAAGAVLPFFTFSAIVTSILRPLVWPSIFFIANVAKRTTPATKTIIDIQVKTAVHLFAVLS